MDNLTGLPEETGDHSRVAAVVSSAFKDEATARLLDRFAAINRLERLSFVGVVDGLVVAQVSFTRGWLDTPAKLVEVLILSSVSVALGWQRKGLEALSF
jgi:predicted N-acetyltransferase YhbS